MGDAIGAAVGPAAPRALRILIIATESPPIHSGIAREVGYLCDGLRAHGHQVDVLAYPAVGRIEIGQVRLSSLITNAPRLLQHMQEYDVIHIHGATPTVSDVALLLARLETHLWKQHPIVLYTHHMDQDLASGGFLNGVYNRLHHRLSARADAVVASTENTLAALGDGCHGVVIPNAVDIEQFSTDAEKDGQFTILFVGQFRPYKGVHVLLKAMSQVRDARLLIVGHGPLEQAYRDAATTRGVDVEFHVGVSDHDLRQLYQRAHVVVLPSVSRAETFGIVLVEGMAAGCIPVASDLPGVREVVGGAGFLFPAGDAGALARLLCRLRDDSTLRQQVSAHARVRAVAYRRGRILAEYEHIITGLVEVRELKRRLADLSAHLELPVLIASEDAKQRLVHDAAACALALRAFATNAWYVTLDAGIDAAVVSAAHIALPLPESATSASAQS